MHYGTKTVGYYARQSAVDWNNNIIYNTELNSSGTPGSLKRQGISARGSDLSFRTVYTYTLGWTSGLGQNGHLGIIFDDGVHMYVAEDNHKLNRVNLLNAAKIIPLTVISNNIYLY